MRTRTSSSLELEELIRGLVRDEAAITLNERVDELQDHRMYCHILGIENTLYSTLVERDILARGRGDLYRSSTIRERILSTEDVDIPTVPVVDMTDDGSIAEEVI